eukprot:6660282-Prymnesium_polylepis.1
MAALVHPDCSWRAPFSPFGDACGHGRLAQCSLSLLGEGCGTMGAVVETHAAAVDHLVSPTDLTPAALPVA